MDILEIISHKKEKKELSQQEINYFVDGYDKNLILDYQISALLMAINLNGLNDNETFFLTKKMLESGSNINLSSVKGIKIDKHSTGGVGDKVSIIMGPLCAALGFKVAKMSGKGLGHTGGTIDKLNSIGVNTNLSKIEASKLLDKNGLFIMSQTEDICPADKKLYDLRNATSTVDSIPLILTSIVSKKIALETDYVFIDVKVGDGGFCNTISKATLLSKKMVKLFKQFNRKCLVHITNMNQPLGRTIGNAIEIKSSIEFLDGKPESKDVKNLIYQFISDILVFTKFCKNKKQAILKIDEVIKNKEALKKFYDWINSQGANVNLIKKQKYFNPKYKCEIKAKKSGYILYKSTKKIGLISFQLGAGRLVKNAPIDYQAGIFLNKIKNEFVKKNETIATLYSSKLIGKKIIKEFEENIRYSNKIYKELPIIAKIIR